MFPINFPATQVAAVDPDVWRACAGESFVVPEVGTVVYYFPVGHAEQCGSPPAVAPVVWPIFSCRVINVRFLADRASDEVFAAVLLQQVGYDVRSGASSAPASRSAGSGGRMNGGEQQEGSRIDSFMKTLTPSDANNGGGFSVKKPCAEAIFPALNYQADPPVQNLTMTDVQGVDWVFRHIFRGTPKRHLLTTGWSKFVNHKKLIAGDKVIFMRDNLNGRLYIGIRRLDNVDSGRRCRSLSQQLSGAGSTGEDGVDEGFWRSGDMRVATRFPEELVRHANQGKPFEIILHPRNGLPDFLMSADVVDKALSIRWAVGMLVKMPVEMEDDSTRSIWRRGHVSKVVNSQENGQWRDSPWKMLQVTWVEPEHMQNVERVSPWQVEYAGPSVPRMSIHSLTELSESHYFQLQAGRNWEPLMGQGDLQSGLLNSSFLNSNTYLASMQGARHLSDVSIHNGGDTHQFHSDDMFQRSDLSLFGSRITEVNLRRSDLSLFGSKITEVNPGGYRSGNFSAGSHSSLRSFGTEIGNLPTPDGGATSIQLFGKLIYVNSPVESQSGNAGCLETDSSSKGNNETEGM